MSNPFQSKSGQSARHWELLQQLAGREISESVRGSALGAAWLVLGPLLSLGLYVVVFGVLFGGKFGQVENETSLGFAIGVYIGLSVVNLINESIGKATGNLFKHTNLIKKVVFPLPILPVVQVAGTGFKLAVNTVLWVAMGFVFGTVLSWEILYLPLIFLPVLAIALGLAALISALSVYIRDIQQVTTLLSQVVFWSSGVFYSSIRVKEVPELWAILKWNPVLLAVENLRNIVLWGLPPDFLQLGYIYLVGIITMAGGFFVFYRLKPGFSDFL